MPGRLGPLDVKAVPRRWALRAVGSLVALSRASEWWDHKLSPLAAVGYAAALQADVPVASVTGVLLIAMVGILLEAVYVSVINDVTDLKTDAAAGKDNRAAGRSPAAIASVIGATVLAGAVLAAVFWREHVALVAMYVGGWASFTLYSVPPTRLKARGVAGAIADGLGAHGFPTMVMCLAVFETQGRSTPPAWLLLVATWAVLLGFRGATWHQLSDLASDRAAGTPTFGARNPALAARIVGTVVFPLECALLATWLVVAAGAIPLIGLAVAIAVELARTRWLGTPSIIVRPRSGARLALHEFYVVVMPLALLIAATARHPGALVVLVGHVALFHRQAVVFAGDVLHIAFTIREEGRERSSWRSGDGSPGKRRH